MPSKDRNFRPWIIRFAFVILAAILVVQLFQMQVVEDKYKIMANDQAIIRRTIFPPRGAILDRKGKAIVANTLSYDLAVTPAKMQQDFDTLGFCQLMGITRAEFEKKMQTLIKTNTALRESVFKPFLTEEENARLQENIYQYSGFDIRNRYTRSYVMGIAPHALGYIHEISEGMLKEKRYKGYNPGDYVGISGLESVYEEALRGQVGTAYIVRDVLNRPRTPYRNGALDTPAIAGKNIDLYMDADLQKFGEELMQNKIGAVVAIEPKTGGILAMVSAPTYDPGLLSGDDFSKNFAALSLKYTRPLFNYAVQGQYPPGSTFKPTDALLGLSQGIITPQFGISCVGAYYGCKRVVGCTEHWAGHAKDLETAIAYSCNSYFCDVFKRFVNSQKWIRGPHQGLQEWHNFLGEFGLGHPLGVDITGEYGGNIPDSNYYNNVYNGSWNGCTMVTNGIGQGEVTETPLQMANVAAMIANHGYYYIPHFVHSIGGRTDLPILKKYQEKHTPAALSDSVFKYVIDGMHEVVEKGTARIAQIPGIEICGKTGTSENYGIIHGKRTKLDNHSIFICFAPRDNPKIAIAAVVQNAGYGSTWAAPVASLMMEKYLTGMIKRQALLDRIKNANTIKGYIRVIDSIQREKDYTRYLLKTADQRTLDSIRKQRDTILVNQVLKDYFKIEPYTGKSL